MAEIDDKNWKTHRWSGWPGAYCQDCFIDDPVEQAIADGADPAKYIEIYCPPCSTKEIKLQ